MSYEAFTPPLAFEPRIRKSPYFEATRRYGAKRYSPWAACPVNFVVRWREFTRRD